MFPDIGVEGTALNTAFVTIYGQRKRADPTFFSRPDWAIVLAQEISTHPEEVERSEEIAQIQVRLAQIDQQINANKKRAFTGHSETTSRGRSWTSVSSDFDQLIAVNNQLEVERDGLQRQLVKLTGEDTRRPEETDEARMAADAYIESLKQDGTVFGSQFKAAISYQLSPPKIEVIYSLDYTDQMRVRLVGPYTITVENGVASGWHVIGSSVGDRRSRFDEPVVGTDGVWSRSPMEQTIGEAMGH